MTKRLRLLLLLLPFGVVTTSASVIEGTVTDQNNSPLIGATVLLKGTNIGAATDVNGQYRIKDIVAGRYVLEVASLGYQTLEKAVALVKGQTLTHNFTLEEDLANLEEVVVTGKSESKKLSENPIQISSIDVVKLQSESADVVSVLDRTSGVRVRQSGGLGSSTTIQLNGLTGLAVRTYYDGIPLELFGGSIQLNNIPVNAIQRVDVYKGVMPVDVGTDALAGGINVK
ncbi:MAG: carboxypeptidase-like regulatory domain-containing protein [Bacteroidota bacterium]